MKHFLLIFLSLVCSLAIGADTPVNNLKVSGTLNGTPSGGTLNLSAVTLTIPTLPVGQGGTGSTTAPGARTNLGLVIGTNVQAYDADLTTWAGLTPSANAQSLVTAANYAAMRALLGLGTGDSPTFAGLTLTGNATLNGTNNTAPNQAGLAASSSTLLTKVQGDEEWLWQTAFRRRALAPGSATYYQSGAVASQLFNGIGLLQLNTTAATNAKATLCVAIHDSYLFGIRFDKRFRVALAGRTEFNSDTTKKARILVGAGYSGSVAASDANALAGTGIGVEITYESGEYRARLVRYNGSYATSGSYAVLSSPANDLALVLENVGNGTINLYAATTSNGIANPSTTPVLTMTGGPTGACDFGACIEWQITNHSTTTGSAAGEVEFRGGALLLEP